MSDRPYDPMSGPPPQGPGYPGQPDPGAQGIPPQGGYPPQGQPGGYPPTGNTPSSYQSAPGSYPSAPGSYPSAGQPDQSAVPASTGSPSYPPGPMSSPGYPPASSGSPSYPPQDQGAYQAASYGSPSGYADPSGQPYPTQAGYVGGSGGGGYGAPPQQPQKGGKGKLFAIIGGALALVLIAAVVIAFVVLKPGGSSPTDTQQPRTAQGAVQGYLEALAAGDAEKALSFAQEQPSSTTFLTNDFLKASIEKAPITEINVSEGTGSDSHTTVSATYRVGSKSVSEDFTAEKIGDEWKLDQVAATGTKPSSWGTLPVTINGMELKGDVITLFPGRYAVGLKNNFVGFANATLTVDGPSTSIRPYNMTPTLNATGRQTIITQSRQLLTKCLSLKQMAPNGCGFAVRMPAGVSAVPSTIRWSRTTAQDPFISANPQLDATDPGVATMTVGITVKVNVTGSDGRAYIGQSRISRVIATVNPDKIQVMFQR